LFNLLSKKSRAMVHDQPGVTRDRKYSEASIADLNFRIIDTPGLESISKHNSLGLGMREQSIKAVQEADAVIFMIDAIDGVIPEDYEFAKLVRKLNNNLILVANKAERKQLDHLEYYKLGLGEPIKISSAHRLGILDIYDVLKKFVPTQQNAPEEAKDDPKAISIAIVGKPNVGKSSFINSILQEDRLLTFDAAGTTRESIDIMWEYKGQKIKFIDTAGIRRKKTIEETLEQLSVGDSLHSIKFANNVVLMLDASEEISKQDLVLANFVIEHGRCLIIVFNKIDLIKDFKAFQEEMHYQLEKSLGQVRNISVVYTSAVLGKNMTQVIDKVLESYSIWNYKVSTSKINKWLMEATTRHTTSESGIKIRIKYGLQTSIRPPTFQFFANRPDKIAKSYKQYLLNSLRDKFGLHGVPIRINYSATTNPYNT